MVRAGFLEGVLEVTLKDKVGIRHAERGEGILEGNIGGEGRAGEPQRGKSFKGPESRWGPIARKAAVLPTPGPAPKPSSSGH